MGKIRFARLTPELLSALPDSYGGEEIHGVPAFVCDPPNLALVMFDGTQIMGAGGLVHIWQGRAIAWFLPGLNMGQRHFGWALARCKRELVRAADAGLRRVECTVRCGNEAGLRFANRLGFIWEGTMHAFSPTGADHELVARVRASERCSS
jgi:RimJ/RimL family protein N-acetyltransferase